MIWTAPLTNARELNEKQFTAGKSYTLNDDGRNTHYWRWGKPYPLDSLAGTDLVLVVADDKGDPCTICKWRFR